MQDHTFQAVLDSIQDGNTLKQAIKDANTSWRALSLHIEASDEAASRYARARLNSAESYADKAQEAVEQAVTGEDATVARVRADVYKWRAKVANPKDYGDRQQVEVSGSVGHLHLTALQAAKVTASARLSALEATDIPSSGPEDAPAITPTITSGEADTPESGR